MSDKSLRNRTEGGPALPVSIVTVVFDTYFFTRLLVEKGRQCTIGRPYAIIVVNRGSTDESLPWLQAQPDVRVVWVPQGDAGHHILTNLFEVSMTHRQLPSAHSVRSWLA